MPGVGPPIKTSSFLLAALSPYLRHLIQSAGEDTCVLLPSLSSHEVQNHCFPFAKLVFFLQLNHFLFTALDPELVEEDLPRVKEVQLGRW